MYDLGLDYEADVEELRGPQLSDDERPPTENRKYQSTISFCTFISADISRERYTNMPMAQYLC